jgi:Protein of unknown function (DUF2892)
MKKNIGSTDKIIRLTASAILVYLNSTNLADGIVDMVLLGVAFTLTITSFINFCPLYSILGINSCTISSKP